MAIPHSKAMPTHIRVGLSVTIFFSNAIPSKKRIFTTIPIAKYPSSSI